MKGKTDRRDARGMAQLVRMGWFRPVHGNHLQDGPRRPLPHQEVQQCRGGSGEDVSWAVGRRLTNHAVPR